MKTLIHTLAHALVRADRHGDDPALDRAAKKETVQGVPLNQATSLTTIYERRGRDHQRSAPNSAGAAGRPRQ